MFAQVLLLALLSGFIPGLWGGPFFNAKGKNITSVSFCTEFFQVGKFQQFDEIASSLIKHKIHGFVPSKYFD